MQKASAAEVQAKFNAFLNESQKEPVVVMGNGKPIAVLMGVHDEGELERLVFASSRRLQDNLAAGRQEIREGRGIPNEEFWMQVEAEQPNAKRSRAKTIAPRSARVKSTADD
jgi:prevent-host-death family protein